MEYVEQVLKSADFSKETNLMETLRKELFPPVKNISFDDLMKKSGVSNGAAKTEQSASRTRSHAAEKTNQIQPPKKNGPTM